LSDSRLTLFSPTIPAINSRCPTGHQLNETVRPLDLWKQVQKSSKYVDFTKVGALLHFLRPNGGIYRRKAAISGMINRQKAAPNLHRGDFSGGDCGNFASLAVQSGAVRFCLLPRLLKGLVVVALHKPGEIGRAVEVLRYLVQHDELFIVGVAHRAEELVLPPDRIGHGAGSLAGWWNEWGWLGEEPK